MVDQVTRVPNAPHFVDGVVFSRGEVVPAVSLRARFGFERAPYDTRTRLIIVTRGGRSRRPHRRRGARVLHDSGGRSNRRTKRSPGSSGEYLRGIATLGDRMIVVLDIDAILDADRRSPLGRNHPFIFTGDPVMATRQPRPTTVRVTRRSTRPRARAGRPADRVSGRYRAHQRRRCARRRRADARARRAVRGVNEMSASLRETAAQADSIATSPKSSRARSTRWPPPSSRSRRAPRPRDGRHETSTAIDSRPQRRSRASPHRAGDGDVAPQVTTSINEMAASIRASGATPIT